MSYKLLNCQITIFGVRSISCKPLLGFSWNFGQMLTTSRTHGPCWLKVTVTDRAKIKQLLYCVRHISPKPLQGFSWNFDQMFNTSTRLARPMFHNTLVQCCTMPVYNMCPVDISKIAWTIVTFGWNVQMSIYITIVFTLYILNNWRFSWNLW